METFQLKRTVQMENILNLHKIEIPIQGGLGELYNFEDADVEKSRLNVYHSAGCAVCNLTLKARPNSNLVKSKRIRRVNHQTL